MPNLKKDPQGKSIVLNINTQFIKDNDSDSSKEQETPPAKIYAFSSQGKLLATSKIKGSGTTKLNIKAPLKANITLAVGPEHDGEIQSLAELKRFNPNISRVKLVESAMDLDILLPPKYWQCWILSRCVVPGNLYKDYGDEAPVENYPIADATVEVYEVDPLRLWVHKIPDSVIDKLRNGLERIPEPINPPIPPIKRFERIEPRWLREVSPIPLRKLKAIKSFKKIEARKRFQEVELNEGFEKIQALGQLPEYQRLQVAAKTQSNFEFRQTISHTPELILPLLCYYFPRLVRKQKLAEATTDACGHFTAVFYRGCNNTDKPDLYFKATQRVPTKGEVTIYEKTPVSCYTHWNYECGTEVTLRSTHPDALASSGCNDLPDGDYVVFKTVGITGMHRIYGAGATGANSVNKGLKDVHNPGSPFGGGLYFSADFSPSLRRDNRFKYYKLSVKGPSTGGVFVPMRHEMKRFYTDYVDGEPVFHSYSLGPDKDGFHDLYEIPDVEAPNNTPWKNGAGSMFYNSLSIGYWDSVEQQDDSERLNHAGLYEIQMQLFDASGNEVDIGSGDFYYLLSTDGPVTDPVAHNNAKDFNLVKTGSGSHLSLIFELHVDNNECEGALFAPEISGVGAGECCGVLNYNSTLATTDMPFVAEHPNGFASYNFNVKRSATQIGSLNMNGQASPPGDFQQTASVSALLSEDLPADCEDRPCQNADFCEDRPCQNAAFAEELDVTAWATNGISRLSRYDVDTERAFALMGSDES